MSTKRKVFVKTDLRVPKIEHERHGPVVEIPINVIPPAETRVRFVDESLSTAEFDFDPWYGVGIDQISYACQRQIERFMAGQDREVTATTNLSYCQQGLVHLFGYLVSLRAALDRDLGLADINRSTIDGFIDSLASGEDLSVFTRRSRYAHAKAVLKALCQRGLIAEVRGGDDATFPANPFPGTDAKRKGAKPFTTPERKSFSHAIRKAVAPLFEDEVELTSDLLAYALLVVALHTGRNTTPLLEMRRDCLKPHPKADTWFLVMYKRRGHSTSKVAIRGSRTDANEIESIPTLRYSVANVIRRVIELTEPLRQEAAEAIRDRVWLFRARTVSHNRLAGGVSPLRPATLYAAILKLVEDHALQDADGKPLRVNISRLRKTFVNRVYEILEGDVASTAAAAGNTIRVTSISYLRPSEDSVNNWRFLGQALTKELLTKTLGATEKTPVGGCSDVRQGEYAPKNQEGPCMSFLNCIRCRNFVVTADDLHRLFSFYWRVLAERARMDARRWKHQFSHIVRLIDRDVVEEGIRRGIFKRHIVEQERERARINPHSFWRSDHAFADFVAPRAA